jgi:hypothetical protein
MGRRNINGIKWRKAISVMANEMAKIMSAIIENNRKAIEENNQSVMANERNIENISEKQ